MFCTGCGTIIASDAKFCTGCGTKIIGVAMAESLDTVAPPSQHGISTKTAERHPTTTGTLIGAVTNTQQHLSGKQSLKIVGAIVVFGGIGAVLIGTLMDRARQKTTDASPLPSASAPHEPVGAQVSPIPAAANLDGPVTANPAAPLALASNNAVPCFNLSKHEPTELIGTLSSQIAPGRPGFDDVRKGDDPEVLYVLTLNQSICIRGGVDEEDDPSDSVMSVTRVQLYPEEWNAKIESDMRALLGFRVKLTLIAVQAGTTGHDHFPMVAAVGAVALVDQGDASLVIPRTLASRRGAGESTAEEFGTAATTVRAFYEALEQGDGPGASEMLIPEKRRTAAYSPESISRFYGPMPEPLRLLSLSPQGPASFLVKYRYRAGRNICQGTASVTTTVQDGLNLIESIHPTDGC